MVISHDGHKIGHPYYRPNFITFFAAIVKRMSWLLSEPIFCYGLVLLKTGNAGSQQKQCEHGRTKWEVANGRKCRSGAEHPKCSHVRWGGWG